MLRDIHKLKKRTRQADTRGRVFQVEGTENAKALGQKMCFSWEQPEGPLGDELKGGGGEDTII